MTNKNYSYHSKPVWAEFSNFFIIGGVVAILSVIGIVWFFTQNNDHEEVLPSNIIRDFNYTIGKEEADLKLLYFTDYQCTFCARYYSVLVELEQEYQNEVLFVHKHHPLQPYSESVGRAVKAAKDQEKYKEMVDLVYVNQNSLDEDSLIIYAESVGLDIDEWNIRRNSEEIRDQVRTDSDDLIRAELPVSSITNKIKNVGENSGTPTVILIKDDRFVDWWSGAISKDQTLEIIDSYLES